MSDENYDIAVTESGTTTVEARFRDLANQTEQLETKTTTLREAFSSMASDSSRLSSAFTSINPLVGSFSNTMGGLNSTLGGTSVLYGQQSDALNRVGTSFATVQTAATGTQSGMAAAGAAASGLGLNLDRLSAGLAMAQTGQTRLTATYGQAATGAAQASAGTASLNSTMAAGSTTSAALARGLTSVGSVVRSAASGMLSYASSLRETIRDAAQVDNAAQAMGRSLNRVQTLLQGMIVIRIGEWFVGQSDAAQASIERFQGYLTRYVTAIDRAYQLSGTFGAAIVMVGRNLDTIGPIVGVLVGALTTLTAIQVAAWMARWAQNATSVAANMVLVTAETIATTAPILLLVAAVTGLVAGLAFLADRTLNAGKGVEYIKTQMASAADKVKGLWTQFTDLRNVQQNAVSSQNAHNKAVSDYVPIVEAASTATVKYSADMVNMSQVVSQATQSVQNFTSVAQVAAQVASQTASNSGQLQDAMGQVDAQARAAGYTVNAFGEYVKASNDAAYDGINANDNYAASFDRVASSASNAASALDGATFKSSSGSSSGGGGGGDVAGMQALVDAYLAMSPADKLKADISAAQNYTMSARDLILYNTTGGAKLIQDSNKAYQDKLEAQAIADQQAAKEASIARNQAILAAAQTAATTSTSSSSSTASTATTTGSGTTTRAITIGTVSIIVNGVTDADSFSRSDKQITAGIKARLTALAS